jgi:hypothetical protein
MSGQIRIRLFASRDVGDPAKFKGELETMAQAHLMENYGEGKEIYITEKDDYTHAVILNTGMPINLRVPKDRVIGLALEPVQFLNLTQEFVQYAKTNIGKYYIGDKYILPEPFVEGYTYMFYNPPLSYIPSKTNRMSLMVSQKNSAPGHKYRHKLVQAILKSDLPIDIWGRGDVYYSKLNDPRIKGRFDRYEPYESYDFHICIENFESNHYFSEKITNTLLCGASPVYLGCRNINTYFPNYVTTLSGSVEHDMVLLRDILTNPEKYKKDIDVKSVHESIDLLHNISKII